MHAGAFGSTGIKSILFEHNIIISAIKYDYGPSWNRTNNFLKAN